MRPLAVLKYLSHLSQDVVLTIRDVAIVASAFLEQWLRPTKSRNGDSPNGPSRSSAGDEKHPDC